MGLTAEDIERIIGWAHVAFMGDYWSIRDDELLDRLRAAYLQYRRAESTD